MPDPDNTMYDENLTVAGHDARTRRMEALYAEALADPYRDED